MRAGRLSDAHGVSLVDATIASGILAVGLVGLALLVTIAVRSASEAHRVSIASGLARQKLEELRALAWTMSPDGAVVSDLSTNTATDPITADGTGLGVSPEAALTEDVPGHADYADELGAPLVAPRLRRNAAYVRRWRVRALESDPADTRIIEVRVVPRAADADAAAGRVDVRRVVVRTRTAR